MFMSNIKERSTTIQFALQQQNMKRKKSKTKDQQSQSQQKKQKTCNTKNNIIIVSASESELSTITKTIVSDSVVTTTTTTSSPNSILSQERVNSNENIVSEAESDNNNNNNDNNADRTTIKSKTVDKNLKRKKNVFDSDDEEAFACIKKSKSKKTKFKKKVTESELKDSGTKKTTHGENTNDQQNDDDEQFVSITQSESKPIRKSKQKKNKTVKEKSSIDCFDSEYEFESVVETKQINKSKSGNTTKEKKKKKSKNETENLSMNSHTSEVDVDWDEEEAADRIKVMEEADVTGKIIKIRKMRATRASKKKKADEDKIEKDRRHAGKNILCKYLSLTNAPSNVAEEFEEMIFNHVSTSPLVSYQNVILDFKCYLQSDRAVELWKSGILFDNLVEMFKKYRQFKLLNIMVPPKDKKLLLFWDLENPNISLSLSNGVDPNLDTTIDLKSQEKLDYLKQQTFTSKTGLARGGYLTCPNCKKADMVESEAIQIRSPDEGPTTFARCLRRECNKISWRRN